VYRGTILALSAAKKHEICEDIYSPQLYVNFEAETVIMGETIRVHLVSDKYVPTPIDEKLQYPVWVRTLQTDLQSEPREELCYKCAGRYFKKRNSELRGWYHIGSAFHPKIFYSTERDILNDSVFSLLHFIGLSSEHVPHEPDTLEKRYVNIQRTLSEYY